MQWGRHLILCYRANVSLLFRNRSLLVFTGNINKTPMDAALSDVSVAAAGQILRFSLLISLLAGNFVAETGSN